MCYSENLGFVAKALDKYPNLFVDITERIGELGRQPYSARKFLIDYADRILFGTDSFAVDPAHYRTTYRFLETDDEYFSYGRNQGRWNIYGVYLPDDVLRKIYHENALKLIPGSKMNWTRFNPAIVKRDASEPNYLTSKDVESFEPWPGGSYVDNITLDAPRTWRNIEVLKEVWRSYSDTMTSP